jgi:hypothetical protein
VNRTVAKRGGPSGKAVLLCFLFSGVPMYCLFYMLPLLAQGLLMALTLPLSSIPGRGPKLYRATSILIAATIWLATVTNVVRMVPQYVEWERQSPFDSMTKRVPEPSDVGRRSDDPIQTVIEDQLPWGHWHFARRSGSLKAVHENRILLFHHAAGFGVTRMGLLQPRPEHFGPDRTPPVPQPEGYEPDAVSLGDEMPADPQRPFAKLHISSLVDFVNPDGWGYVKSRTEVAGFRPHRFSRVPEPVEKWEVRRVELIGLLLHEQPAVYVSEHLPRMDEL